MPRFAVLTHDWPTPHFDLLLEGEGNCRTWRLATEPYGEVPAERIPDHRKDYLDYEGPVSGGRGTVTRWEAGTYREVGRDARVVTVEFFGRRLRGTARWRSEANAWTFGDI